MKVSRERLQIIGRMIGVLREEKRQNKQNNWTQIKFCENICSPNTLKSIESGKVGRSDDIYEQLLEKLGLKYGEYPLIDEAIDKIVDELYDAIEYFDNNRIENLTIKALKVLDTVREYVYYNEFYSLFQDVRDYYLSNEVIEEKKAEHYFNIMNLFTIKIKDVLKLIAFAGIKQKCLSDLVLYDNYIKILDVDSVNLPCLKMSLLQYYHITNERYKIMELSRELENVFLDERNYIRLLDVYNAAISGLSLVDKSLSRYYEEKIKKILSEHLEIPINKKSEAYANIAFSYYNQNDYNKTIEFMNKSLDEGCDDLLSSYLIIVDCQNHLGINIEIPEIDKGSLRKYPRELRMMYNYFLMYKGENVPDVFKQKILMKQIAPLLVDAGTIEIFSFELKKLVKKTNSYKDLSSFDEIIKKNIRSRNLS